MTRAKVKDLIRGLAKDNAKVPSNILNSVGNIRLSQLMDHKHWDFKDLEKTLIPWSDDDQVDEPASDLFSLHNNALGKL